LARRAVSLLILEYLAGAKAPRVSKISAEIYATPKLIMRQLFLKALTFCPPFAILTK
jgi:hypothetical protein